MQQKTLDQWEPSEGPRVLRVSEVTGIITALLDHKSLSNLWVTGEITNYKKHSSGHLYFSLSEVTGKGETAISCTMWKQAVRFLPFTPQDGMRVQAYGSIQHYERGGRYSFNVTQIRPSGAGEKAILIEEWRRELTAKGCFAPERKRTLPRYPERIGVVTSRTGAVLQDIRNVASGRFPVEIILSPSAVQGPAAHEEIARAIRLIGDCVDLVIVGRGGGSFEDLFPFNHPAVVEAIASCPVPVVAAIGHEVDVTLADMAADVRASTPSHAAEISIPDRKSEQESLHHLRQRMRHLITERLASCLETTDTIRERISCDRMQRILSDRYQHLADLSDRFCGATSRSLERRHLLLAGLGTAIKAKNPAQILSREIPERKENLSTLAGRLIQSAGSSLMKRRMEIEITAARLASCGPEAIWNRGFCLVMKEGRPVPGAGTLEVDDQVLLRFRDGIADAVIRMVNTHEKV